MRISFYNLQICYVVFIDWAGLFNKMSLKIIKKPLAWRYNQAGRFHQWLMVVAVKFDILNCIGLEGEFKTPLRPSANQLLVKIVGSGLLLINSFFGFHEIMNGWPFACYPTFGDRLTEAKTDTITAYGLLGDKEETISFDVIKQGMELSNFSGLIQSILQMRDTEQRMIKLKTLLAVMKQSGIDLSKYSKIRFYKTVYSTQPGRFDDPPLSKELLVEIGH